MCIRDSDKYGFIDENDVEFAEFINNLDFMDLAAELLGDFIRITEPKKARKKKNNTKKSTNKLEEELIETLLFTTALDEELINSEAKKEDSDNSWETDEEIEIT
eukprot:TRINITY_DN14967_c0_g2_i5.p1 TRINITY_DN14967_c0_g2~~TRINITY_DN14967_c0_g2_i5.p1  ORF type:complete len:104 (+),score=39.48 TRINITY_DN14967_c0_g2_i5:73-384(+)